MSKLVNLQHLDIEGIPLKEMPSEMGKLRKLRKLKDFFLGKQGGSSIKELGSLSHLRESLRIWNLQNVADVQDALDANLKSKEQIEELLLRWEGDTDDTKREREVLEKLEPSMKVERLGIIGYGGTKFPNWVGNSSFTKMVSLGLSGCKNCTSLPPLGQLPSLEVLYIGGFDQVVDVGLEFYGSDSLMGKPFKSLKTLMFKDMPEWKEWNTDVAGAFPVLEVIQLYACPKLMGSFPAAPKLTDFNLRGRLHIRQPHSYRKRCLEVLDGSVLKRIKRGSGAFSSITEVEFYRCSSLKSCQLDFLPHFFKFTIEACEDLQSLVVSEGPLLSLHQLAVKGCPKLKSLPENMYSILPSLEELELYKLPQVDSLPELPSTLKYLEIHELRNLSSLGHNGLQHLTSLRYLKIWRCPQLEIIPEVSLPSSIEHLYISYLKNLECKRLQHLTSLRHLNIWGFLELESVPEEGLPSSLESLKIEDLENLKSLNYKGLQHLNSIRHLQIRNCPKLQSMPEEGLPSSLEFLEIINCPLLIKRCERKTGEDWPKISHIRRVTMY